MNLRVCNKEEGISEPYISFIKNKKKKNKIAHLNLIKATTALYQQKLM